MTKYKRLHIIQEGGAACTKDSCVMEQKEQNPQQHSSGRPSRLEKQEEFEEEEEIMYMPSPVTIQIEDRGGGLSDDDDKVESECKGFNGSKTECFEVEIEKDVATHVNLTSTVASETYDSKRDKCKVPSQRVKLLVRSQAVHDDASPPPDLETVIANSNMLSVTNAPAFATQTQSKSSNKNRLGRQGSSQGSQGSTESSSGLSRDSSTETYTDSTGVDLQQFIIDTLHKNQKDRMMLLKIEQDLIALVKDTKRHTFKFGQMSSYNRMLVHRVAAFFGLDHYVDGSGTSVIVNKTKNTRITKQIPRSFQDELLPAKEKKSILKRNSISFKERKEKSPDSRFQDHFRDELLPEEPKKSILKRDSISFEEGKEKSPERQSSTDSRRSKSFEEREEEYEKARARIFNKDEGLGESPISHRGSQEDIRWPSSDTRPWSSTDSDSSGRPLGAKGGSSFETEGVLHSVTKTDRTTAVLGKAESDSKEVTHNTRTVRPVMTKASSFGGISVLSKEFPGGRQVTPKITKAESFNVTTLSSSQTSLSSTSQPLLSVTSSPSPSQFVSSTSAISLQTTSPSQIPSAAAQQTFPMVAGQPTQLHLPIQQYSSQISGWSVGNKDSSGSAEYSGHPVPMGQQPVMWPVSSAPDLLFPGGVVLGPQAAPPYVNVDNVLYRYKISSNSSGQPILLTSFQPLNVNPLQNQVPISSHVSPPSQHPPPPSLPVQSNLSLTVQPPVQQQLPQHAPSQQTAMQIPQPQTPTVLYVPYIQSQIQTPVSPQVTVGGSSSSLQTLQPSSQQQPLPHQSNQHILSDQRVYALNPTGASVDEMTAQIQGLGFLPTHMQPQSQQSQDLTSTARQPNLVNIDASSSPHNYILSNFKSQSYASPQGNVPQVPMYYIPQIQQTSNVHPVRYIFPGSSVAQHGVASGQVGGSGMTGQVMADVQTHATAQASSQITGSQYLPGYPVLALPQTGDASTPSTFVSYTLAAQTTAITTTTSVLVPSSPMTMPIYPYGNLFISNLGSNQTPFTTPSTTQSQSQQPSFVQTPMAMQAPSTALSVYVLTTTVTQTATAPTQIGAMTSPFASFRSQSLPSAPSNGSSTVLNPQLQTVGSSVTGAMGYIYAPQQVACTLPQPPHTTSVTVSGLGASSALSSQPVSSQLPPAILTTFQVLRPNLSLVGSLRTGTPPPTQQTFLSQFTSSSSNKMPPLSFPLVKQASDPGVDCFGLGSGSRADQFKCGRGLQLQAVTSTGSGPTTSLVYRRGVPLVQGDLCLIGHPLQHRFSPMIFPGQRPIARFMHPTGTSSTPSSRPPKNRNKRNKSNQSSGSGNGSRNGGTVSGSTFQNMLDITTSHMLEIEGLPDGMRGNEVDRYLEQVISHGAKIQYLDAESGAILNIDSSSEFVVGARHIVVAIFESDTAAQSALLGIKTTKFQLRPLRRNVSDVAQKKYS